VNDTKYLIHWERVVLTPKDELARWRTVNASVKH
jgi:hypothetical protein